MVGRGVQGLGGAIASAVSLSLMVNLFTEPGERAKAMGIFGFVASGGGSIGVLLGGILTDVLNWHRIFLVNFPIGVAVVLLPAETAARGAHTDVESRLDVAGGHDHGLPDDRGLRDRQRQPGGLDVALQTVGLLAVAFTIFAVFIVIETRVSSPLLPLALFRLRNLSVSSVVGVLCGRSAVRVVLLDRALSPARARLQPASGRPRVPPWKSDHGRASIGLSAKLVMRYGFRAPGDLPLRGLPFRGLPLPARSG